jgi:hypothetical protein
MTSEPFSGAYFSISFLHCLIYKVHPVSCGQLVYYTILKTVEARPGPHPYVPPYADVPLTAKNLAAIFSGCGDLQKRSWTRGFRGVPVTAMWLDGIVSGGDVSERCSAPADGERPSGRRLKTTPKSALSACCGAAVYANTAKKCETAPQIRWTT